MLDQLFEGLSAEARESMIGILDDNIMSMDTTSANTGNAYARASAYAENDDENAEVLKYMTDKDSEHVFVDAHVLGTPSLADANNDGHEDLVLSVSYFFDEDDFNSFPHRFPHVPEDVSIHNYVAGGMLVYDLHNREVLWSQHLDLTTDSTKLQAFIYSSPTIIDLDGDGELEVVVGTSLGFIYVMRARDGEIKSGFPIFMNEIQARVTVEDVTGDGTLEMIALDHSGNVLCFNSKGEEIWETNIGGFSAQGATFGDVNGDGQMDVLIGTVTGHVWALRGKNGDVLPHFPVKTNGKIIAPLTITNLHSRTHQQAMNERKDAPQRESQTQGRQKESTKTTKTGPVGTTTTERDGLHIVFPSFDGYVYIVNGATGCSNKVDIGEHSYSMVLVDDVLGNGKLDLLVTTMSGNVFCFSTDAPYHPMRAWTSEGQGRNGFTHAAGYHGIAASEETRGHRDVIGKTFPFEFEITDNRAQRLDEKTTNEKTNKNKNKNKNNIDAMDSDATGEESNTGRNIGDAGVNTNSNNRYHVSLKHGNQVLFSASYEEAGVYIEQVPTLSIPMTARLSLEMTNEHQQLFTDRFTLSFNLGFYKLIKWLLVLPFALLCFLLIFVKSLKTQLPL